MRQAQYDKAKRKSLLAPSTAQPGQGAGGVNPFDRPPQDDHGGGVNIGAVIGGMDANGVQGLYLRLTLLNAYSVTKDSVGQSHDGWPFGAPSKCPLVTDYSLSTR